MSIANIFTRDFILDYFGWMIAFVPFLPLWAFWVEKTSVRGGLLVEVFDPDWVGDMASLSLLQQRLWANFTLFLLTYFTAFALFAVLRAVRLQWKYNVKSNDDVFVAGEAAQCLSGAHSDVNSLIQPFTVTMT